MQLKGENVAIRKSFKTGSVLELLDNFSMDLVQSVWNSHRISVVGMDDIKIQHLPPCLAQWIASQPVDEGF